MECYKRPLIFSTSGGWGPSATVTFRRLARLITSKVSQLYSMIHGFIRCQIRELNLHSQPLDLIAIANEAQWSMWMLNNWTLLDTYYALLPYIQFQSFRVDITGSAHVCLESVLGAIVIHSFSTFGKAWVAREVIHHIACYTLAQVNNCSRRFSDSTVTFISELVTFISGFTDEGDRRVTETSGTIINLG